MGSRQGPWPKSLPVKATQTMADPAAAIPSHPPSASRAPLLVLGHGCALAPSPAHMGRVLTWVRAWGLCQTDLVQLQCGPRPAVWLWPGDVTSEFPHPYVYNGSFLWLGEK